MQHHYRHTPSRLITMALSLVPLLGGIGCGKSKGGSEKIQNIFIHGDPMNVIGKAKTDANSFFTTDTMDTFRDFNLFGGVLFEERTPKSNNTNSEQGNEASSGEEAVDLDHYIFAADDGKYIYRNTASDKSLQLVFTPKDSRLELTALRSKNLDDQEVTMIHYSLNAAKDAFSLLFTYKDLNAGTVLGGIYFTKNSTTTVTLEKTDDIYKYHMGPGIKAYWRDAIGIGLCGSISQDDITSITSGIQAWATDGKIGTHALTITPSDEAPPFTDMNKPCVTIADGFAFEDQENMSVYGLTITPIDKTRAAIVGGHIIISQKAFAKDPKLGDAALRRTLMSYVTAHEFGHFLGLDHEFTKNADGSAKYDSIMSYSLANLRDHTPRQHDREAISKLYGP